MSEKITNRANIAHELGHAIIANLHDPLYTTEYIELHSSTIANAVMWPKPRTEKTELINGHKSYISIVDLGGMFGELLYRESICLWQCRFDILSFLLINRNSLGFRTELDNWFYTDLDSKSFHKAVLCGNKRTRLHRTFDINFIQERLPKTFRLYKKLVKDIDKDIFIQIVNDIHSNNRTELKIQTIDKIVRDVLK